MATAKMVLNPRVVGKDAQRLEEQLKSRIVGQDHAIEQVVAVYQTYLAGMSAPGRPVGSFLFLGPTGTGKTRLVEATAEALAGDARAVVKIDCGEYQHSHEIAKLLGSPPGYIGHRETHPLLSQETLSQYHSDKCQISFVLFDEVEKASDALWHLMLGVLDKGVLTLGDNRRVDFSNTMVFMTANAGASEMSALMTPGMGFARSQAAAGSERLWQQVQESALGAVRKKFTPEFVNRIDKMVVFHPLAEPQLRQILDLEIDAVQDRILHSEHGPQFVLRVGERARDFLLSDGLDVKYGARHLKRSVERNLVGALSSLIATDQVKRGDVLSVDAENGQLAFSVETETPPAARPAPNVFRAV